MKKNLKIIGIISLWIIAIIGFVLLIVAVTNNNFINPWIGAGMIIAGAGIGSIILWGYIGKDIAETRKLWSKEIKKKE